MFPALVAPIIIRKGESHEVIGLLYVGNVGDLWG